MTCIPAKQKKRPQSGFDYPQRVAEQVFNFEIHLVNTAGEIVKTLNLGSAPAEQPTGASPVGTA